MRLAIRAAEGGGTLATWHGRRARRASYSRSRSRRCSRSSSSTPRSPAAGTLRSRRATWTAGREEQLVGIVVGPVRGDSHAGGMHFLLQDRDGTRETAVPVLYTGSKPDLFKAGREIVVDRSPAEGDIRRRAGLDDHEVPVEVRAEDHARLQRPPTEGRRAPCLSSVAQRSSSRSASRHTRWSPAQQGRTSGVAGSPRRRRTRSSQRSSRRPSPRRCCSRRFSGTTSRSSTSHGRRARRFPPVHDLGVLGRPGGIAAPLASLPDRLRSGGSPAQPSLGEGSRRLGRPGLRGRGGLLLVPRRRGGEPVRDAGCAGGRRRNDAEPPEPVHARAPAAPLPGLRGAHGPVRVLPRRPPLRPSSTSAG